MLANPNVTVLKIAQGKIQQLHKKVHKWQHGIEQEVESVGELMDVICDVRLDVSELCDAFRAGLTKGDGVVIVDAMESIKRRVDMLEEKVTYYYSDINTQIWCIFDEEGIEDWQELYDVIWTSDRELNDNSIEYVLALGRHEDKLIDICVDIWDLQETIARVDYGLDNPTSDINYTIY